MIDRDELDQFMELVCDRYTAAEVVEILEDAGLIDVHIIVSLLEEYLIEGSSKFEL